MTAPDGGIYWLGFNRAGVHMVGTVIRGDWLEKLGMELPETTDEFVRAMKAFRDQDMNGNGISDDELPWAEWNTTVFYKSMFPSFGMQAGGATDWVQDETGLLSFAFTTENYKELMEWLNMVYREKLIPQDLNVPNGGPGYEFMSGNLGAAQQLLDGQGKDASWARGMKVPGAYWLAMPPLMGPHGDRGMAVRSPSSSESYALTRDSQYKNEVVGFMDYYLASQEGNAANMGGVPEAWEIKDGWPQQTEKFNNASADDKKKMKGIYFHPWWEYEERYFSWFSDQCVEDYKNFNQYITPIILFSGLYATLEENEVIQEYWAGPEGISTYVNDMAKKFISGEEPLTNWDQYVAQVKALGIDKVLEVNQTKYDRMLKALGQL
jgi:putative aldouronate transport system substrate-binding protein